MNFSNIFFLNLVLSTLKEIEEKNWDKTRQVCPIDSRHSLLKLKVKEKTAQDNNIVITFNIKPKVKKFRIMNTTGKYHILLLNYSIKLVDCL